MTAHLHLQHLWVGPEDLPHLVEDRLRTWAKRRAVGVELNPLQDADHPGFDAHRTRAATVLWATWCGRALVVHIEHGVVVVVRIRAAVVVLPLVEILGLVGATVLRVEEAVAIVVGLGAAVLVLEAVHVLGLVGAAVPCVRDAVAIVVEVGATVLVFEAVHVLGLIGTTVARVRDAVAVVVVVGTAVFVLEAVHVLGFVDAAIQLVDDAVVILIWRSLWWTRLWETDRREQAHIRHARGLRQTKRRPTRERQPHWQRVANTEQQLRRRAQAREGLAVAWRGAAEQLAAEH